MNITNNNSQKAYYRKDTIVTLGVRHRRLLMEEADEHFQQRCPPLKGKIQNLLKGDVQIFRHRLDELKQDDSSRKEFNPFITDCLFQKKVESSKEVCNKKTLDTFDSTINYYDPFDALKGDYDEGSKKTLDDSKRDDSSETEEEEERQKSFDSLEHPSQGKKKSASIMPTFLKELDDHFEFEMYYFLKGMSNANPYFMKGQGKFQKLAHSMKRYKLFLPLFAIPLASFVLKMTYTIAKGILPSSFSLFASYSSILLAGVAAIMALYYLYKIVKIYYIGHVFKKFNNSIIGVQNLHPKKDVLLISL
ncbi:hypothetical protein PCYB_033010 [Plasmodium cynomolgi strain B]|uniref:Pv-fam-d protein n=1 Tax=Plasmodium cynomolgi (strain B) TaxID=1120755 RepID=K6USF6_PLACD|nr:hypothetical protein PCYB_033010 [Plasmodium cynomolgi strain B]GAB64890.1 hypothetical protein PCYB_033010 [Plasmodium cynomolgi strain B]